MEHHFMSVGIANWISKLRRPLNCIDMKNIPSLVAPIVFISIHRPHSIKPIFCKCISIEKWSFWRMKRPFVVESVAICPAVWMNSKGICQVLPTNSENRSSLSVKSVANDLRKKCIYKHIKERMMGLIPMGAIHATNGLPFWNTFDATSFACTEPHVPNVMKFFTW